MTYLFQVNGNDPCPTEFLAICPTTTQLHKSCLFYAWKCRHLTGIGQGNQTTGQANYVLLK